MRSTSIADVAEESAGCTVGGVGNPASPECIRRLPLIAEQPLMPDMQVTTVNRDYLDCSTLFSIQPFLLYIDPRSRWGATFFARRSVSASSVPMRRPIAALATFTAALSDALCANGAEVSVVRVADGAPSSSDRVIGELVNGSATSVAASCRAAEPERRRRHPARVRNLWRGRRRRRRGHHRRAACAVDRRRPHSPQRSDATPAFGAGVDRGDGGSSGRHVRGRKTTVVCRIRRRQPKGHHDPARRGRPDRRCREASEQTHPLDVGVAGSWEGCRAGHRLDDIVERLARPAAVSGRRPDAPEGPCRRRRGISRCPQGPGAPPRRSRFGELRLPLLERVDVACAHSVRLGRRAAL